jgi:WD40 repeat protein
MVLAIRFSPDGKLVAWGGTDNAIHIADTDSHKEKLLIQQHADWVQDLNFNAEGTKLVSASRDRSARIYDIKTGDLEATYTGHEGPVNTAAFTADSKRAVSGGRDKRLHLWNTKDGSDAGTLGSCEGEIVRIRIQGNDVLVSSTDNMVRQFNLSEKKLMRTLPGPAETAYDLAFGGDSLLAAGYFNGEIQVWSRTNGTPQIRFLAAPGCSMEKR